jgi:hypothetical protein
MLQSVLHLRFADPGRTVAAPARAARPAAKCNDAPKHAHSWGRCIPTAVRPAPSLSLALDFARAGPQRIQRGARAPARRRRVPRYLLPQQTGLQRAVQPRSAGVELPGRGGDPGAPRRGRVLHGEHGGARGRGASSSIGAGVELRSGIPAGEADLGSAGSAAAASSGSSEVGPPGAISPYLPLALRRPGEARWGPRSLASSLLSSLFFPTVRPSSSPPPPLLLLSLRAREPTAGGRCSSSCTTLLEAPLPSCVCILSLLLSQ